MTDDHLHERLSAHLDGEGTDAERAEVERLLADDPEARAVFEELSNVSSAVRGLPSIPAPVDLRHDVLTAILRPAPPMTVPSPMFPSRESPEPAPAATRIAAVASVVVTLACTLVVALVLDRDGDGTTRPGQDVAAVDPAKPNDGATEVDAEFTARARRGDEDFASREFARKNEFAKAAPGVGADEELERAEQLYVFKEADLKRAKDFVEPVEATLENLEVGDVVPFVDRDGGRVAVVEVMVVDVERVLGEVRLLLRRNAIREVDAVDGRRRARQFDDDVDDVAEEFVLPGGKEGETFAVYVSADARRIATTLEELRRSQHVVSLDAPSPEQKNLLALQANRPGPGTRSVVPKERTTLGATPPRAAPPAAAAEAKPAEPAADAPADAMDREDRHESDDSPDGVELAGRDSYQVLRRYRSTAAKKQLARLATESRGLLRDEALRKLEDEKVTDGSLRVLILLRPATTKPAAGNEPAGPSR